jgi:hypothetical protein
VITLSFPQRIACATATLFGRYGAVTRIAHEYGLCRQTVYRQTDAVRADLDAPAPRQEVLDLRQQLEQARAQGADLQRRLDDAVVLDQDRQAEFAATAQAEGVSLPVACRLLRVVLGQRTPRVAKLGRKTKAAAQRAAALLPVLDEHTRQDDHFHVLRDGQRALRISAGQANRAVDRAWKADKKERKRRRGPRPGKGYGQASAVALRWRQAEAVYARWCSQEQAWHQVTSAFTLFDASGHLQTRAQAEATVAAALPVLTGNHWAKARAALCRPQLWTYLDRAHQQLAALPVPAELRQAALRVEAARRRPGLTAGERVGAAAARALVLVASVLLSRAGPAGAAALAAVRALLAGVWRASSGVEGINSVLRMQQSRHRRLTQGLLDLKRLYWNCHAFRTGKRKRQSPYGRLGVPLPARSWWEIQKLSPEQLRQLLPPPPPAEPLQELSPQDVAA